MEASTAPRACSATLPSVSSVAPSVPAPGWDRSGARARASVAVVVGSEGAFFAVVLDAALSVAVVAATAWWAFTTRRVWKRRLNVALAVLVAAALLAVLVRFGLGQALGVVA